MNTDGFYLLGLSFLYLFVWRKSESGDRFEIWERQSGDRCVSFSAFSQFTDNVLLHRRFHLSRHGMTVPFNSLVLDMIDSTCEG